MSNERSIDVARLHPEHFYCRDFKVRYGWVDHNNVPQDPRALKVLPLVYERLDTRLAPYELNGIPLSQRTRLALTLTLGDLHA